MYNQHKILRVLQLISMLKARPPKTIRHLSNVLESTERTVYRYLDLLNEVGFQVERDPHNRIFIDNGPDAGSLHFNAEEVMLIKSLMLTVGKGSLLKDSILKKLYINSDVQLNGQHLLKAHLGKIVESIAGAIQQRRQIVLKKYHSVNSNIISDRLVEPVKFTDNYQSLAAYEIKSGMNKFFNIERITAVEITGKPFKYINQHQFSLPDVFGFSDSDQSHDIDLVLNMRTMVLLKEQYPMTTALIKPDGKPGAYRFRTTVYDLKPVTRFVLGFLDEITVVGSPYFKTHLQQLVSGWLGVKNASSE